jgi:hypothetical protein
MSISIDTKPSAQTPLGICESLEPDFAVSVTAILSSRDNKKPAIGG